MNLKTIQDKLNTTFAEGSRIIFWFDDKAEYNKKAESLVIDAKLLRLTGDNYLYAKHLLEIEDPESKYLVYAPFPRPSDEENHLADTVYYSRLFSTDKMTHISVDLGIPEDIRFALTRYPQAFWDDDNTDKFAALGIEEYRPICKIKTAADEYVITSIDVGVFCVLAGVKTPNFDEVLKTILLAGNYKDNPILAKFKAFSADFPFWMLCREMYGYKDAEPCLERFIVMLLLTYVSHTVTDALPRSWEKYISDKKNSVVVFVSNYMNNAQCRASYMAMSKDFGDRANVRAFFEKTGLENYLDCDAFTIIDEVIVETLIKYLAAENVSIQFGGCSIGRVCSRRISGAMFFAQEYADQYQAINHAYRFMTSVRGSWDKMSAQELLEAYKTKLYQVDLHYRKFCYYYDKAGTPEAFTSLARLIENIYANEHLNSMAKAWSQHVGSIDSFALSANQQEKFYNSLVKNAADKHRIVVLISDAFRYECAAELVEQLTNDDKWSIRLDSAFSVLPSITKYGMAALLPHKEMLVSEDGKITLDGYPCADMPQRQIVLQNVRADSICLKLDQILSMRNKTKGLKEICGDKKVIYIYHNQVDARGDDATTENEVFIACEEAIAELIRCMQLITTANISTHFILTADHGFLYRRNPVAEHDKINIDKQNLLQSAKRYLVSYEKPELTGTVSVPFSSMKKPGFVSFPIDAGIFKVSGGGQNYVHGGSSLQEMLIPVVFIETKKEASNAKNAKLTLMTAQHRITNLISYIEFVQAAPIGDQVKATDYRIRFEDANGNAISADVFITADKNDASPEHRIFKQRFTLINRRYTKKEKYYLVVQNINDAVAEPDRYEFVIDIAFADDFGFGVKGGF